MSKLTYSVSVSVTNVEELETLLIALRKLQAGYWVGMEIPTLRTDSVICTGEPTIRDFDGRIKGKG